MIRKISCITNYSIVTGIFSFCLLFNSLNAKAQIPVEHNEIDIQSQQSQELLQTPPSSENGREWQQLYYILKIIGIIIGIGTAIIAIFKYILDQRLKPIEQNLSNLKEGIDSNKTNLVSLTEKINELNSNVNNGIEGITELRNTSLLNTVLSAEIALYNLPDMTQYTQQIPLYLTMGLEVISKTFFGPSGKDLHKFLEPIGIKSRILYAIGLCELGKYSINRNKLTNSPSTDSIPKGIINIFLSAKTTNNTDFILKRNILVRLIQAIRQIDDYDHAKEIIKDLADLDSNQADPSARIIATWANAVIKMQQGLNMVDDKMENDKQKNIQDFITTKRELYLNAAQTMDNLYSKVFGWQSYGNGCDPRFYSLKNDSNLTYYVAKAMWLYRFTYDYDSQEYMKNSIQDFDIKFKEVLIHSLALFIITREKYIEDPCIASIYNFCVALILTVRETIPEIGIAPTKDDIKLIPDDLKRYLTHIGDKPFWEDYRKQCIDSSEELIKLTRHYANTFTGLDSFGIYVEHKEKLDHIDRFEEGIIHLKNVVGCHSNIDKFNMFKELYLTGNI